MIAKHREILQYYLYIKTRVIKMKKGQEPNVKQETITFMINFMVKLVILVIDYFHE